MTDRHRLATLFRAIADELEAPGDQPTALPPNSADAMPQLGQRPQVFAPPQPAPAAPAFDPASVNMATHCPKHGTEYRRGNYGLYCPHQTDDPAFADRKGYCSLPGKDAANALAWVAVQRAAKGGAS
jgi:hypothetical protein